MNFSTDRDLLVMEPGVFVDAGLLAQQRVKVSDGVLAGGTTLTSAGADFAAAGVGAGSVVLVGGVAMEVVDRVDGQTLTVSMVRGGVGEELIGGKDGTGLEVVVRTFGPQARLVHDVLLRMVGIEGEDLGNQVTEDAIVSLSVMSRLETLGTLAQVYAGVAGVVGDQDGVWKKAKWYGREYRKALEGAVVLMDEDGDGYADQKRRLGVGRLVRV